MTEVLSLTSQSKKTIPSPSEIDAARTPAGGWTRATLAGWGISWPPRRGWKAKLEQAYRKQQKAEIRGEQAPVQPTGQNENLKASDLVGNRGGGVWTFLVPRLAGKRAHIWAGDDTLCRMASTGGVDATKYVVSDESNGFPVCSMCQSVAAQHETEMSR